MTKRSIVTFVAVCTAYAACASEPVGQVWSIGDSEKAVSLAFPSKDAEERGSPVVTEALRQAREIERAQAMASHWAPNFRPILYQEFGLVGLVYCIKILGRLKSYDQKDIVLSKYDSVQERAIILAAFGVGLAQVNDIDRATAVNAELEILAADSNDEDEDERKNLAVLKTIIPIAVANKNSAFETVKTKADREKLHGAERDIWFEQSFFRVESSRQQTPFRSAIIPAAKDGDIEKVREITTEAINVARQPTSWYVPEYNSVKLADIIDDLMAEKLPQLTDRPFQLLIEGPRDKPTRYWDIISRARAYAARGSLRAALAEADEFGPGPDGVSPVGTEEQDRLKNRFLALEAITKSLVFRGDIEAARKVAYSLCTNAWDAVGVQYQRDNMLQFLANAESDAGDFHGALETTERIQTQTLRNNILPRLISVPVGTNVRVKGL